MLVVITIEQNWGVAAWGEVWGGRRERGGGEAASRGCQHEDDISVCWQIHFYWHWKRVKYKTFKIKLTCWASDKWIASKTQRSLSKASVQEI